jgi:hypothetical protein
VRYHWLVLDDDDGDFSNGTPHQDEISCGFAAHGFPPGELAVEGLSAPHVPEDEFFGHALALDGKWLVAGVPNSDWGPEAAGAAYVYASDGEQWQPVTELLPDPDPLYDYGFGYAVAIDGNTIAVGYPYSSDQTGSVYVYEHTPSGWLSAGTLTTPTSLGLGISLALDGDTMVAGALAEYPGGAAYVFTYENEAWTQAARLVGSDTQEDDAFGASVDTAFDRIVVGAPWANGDRGAAYVFVHGASGWTEETKLVGDPTYAANFGRWVSLASDGGELAVGAPLEGATEIGAVYVFVRTGSTWSRQARIPSPLGGADPHQHFGSRLALDASSRHPTLRPCSTTSARGWRSTSRPSPWERRDTTFRCPMPARCTCSAKKAVPSSSTGREPKATTSSRRSCGRAANRRSEGWSRTTSTPGDPSEQASSTSGLLAPRLRSTAGGCSSGT